MTDDHDNNQSMYQNQQTLIKYDNPVLVSHPDKSSTKTSVKVSSLYIEFLKGTKLKLIKCLANFLIRNNRSPINRRHT